MDKISFVLLWATLLALAFRSGAENGVSSSRDLYDRNGRYILTQEAFRNDVMGKIGTHVYYSYNVFEGRNLSADDEKEIVEYLKRVDEELNEDVFITGFGKVSHSCTWRFYAEQYLNGAVIPEVRYRTDVDTTKPNLCLVRGEPVKELDTSWVIEAPTLIPAVKELALKHANELCDYDRDGLYAKYLLTYDVRTDTLEYDFVINETSHIIVDAFTGLVISESYWDGVCEDLE
ncbi:MAG: hypothetical protein IK081_06395 [Lachnospiraceae bacterium]|nr:hypothetical protein [Lachnospiraceae bacterium]